MFLAYKCAVIIMKGILCAFFVVNLVAICTSEKLLGGNEGTTKHKENLGGNVSLRVAVYNYIPDINGDGLKSYTEYITKKWEEEEPNVRLTLVAGSEYNPYGNLNEYLGSGSNSFDLIETDMVRIGELYGKVVQIKSGHGEREINISRYFPVNVRAVTHEGSYLGYPTLACANSITEIKRDGVNTIDLDSQSYELFVKSAKKAKTLMVFNGNCGEKIPIGKFARLLGGKITDDDGWYLPYIYLDGVIAFLGPLHLQKEIENVLNNKPNQVVVDRLIEFFTLFQDNCGNFGQERSTENDVANGIDAYLFGFTEKLSMVLKYTNYSHNIQPKTCLSPRFGEVNQTSIFTDALVMNKAKYDTAGKKQKEAMYKFAKFFTSDGLRADLIMGKDLSVNRIRYLMLPNKDFYKKTTNHMYKAYHKLLENGIPIPQMSPQDRSKMQKVLEPLVFGKSVSERIELFQMILILPVSLMVTIMI